MNNVQKQGLHLKESFAFNISINAISSLCHFLKIIQHLLRVNFYAKTSEQTAMATLVPFLMKEGRIRGNAYEFTKYTPSALSATVID